jgi:hypothetical protein
LLPELEVEETRALQLWKRESVIVASETSLEIKMAPPQAELDLRWRWAKEQAETRQQPPESLNVNRW